MLQRSRFAPSRGSLLWQSSSVAFLRGCSRYALSLVSAAVPVLAVLIRPVRRQCIGRCNSKAHASFRAKPYFVDSLRSPAQIHHTICRIVGNAVFENTLQAAECLPGDRLTLASRSSER